VPAELFVDATYVIALVSKHDQHHTSARQLAVEVARRRQQLVTTRAVVIEVANALAKLRFRSAALSVLESLETDETVHILPVDEDLYRRGWTIYRRHRDKEWGLTDCISFAVMAERGIQSALTADDHFRQAGFLRLLVHDA
jgi:hypothetical protein